MSNLTKHIFHKNPDSKQLDLILPGQSAGIESSLIQKLINKSITQGNNVLAINHPYFERGEKKYSKNLSEEMESLSAHLATIKLSSFEHIRIIGKSLGGILGSLYLKNLQDNSKYLIVVLGYIPGVTDFKDFKGEIKIIQGDQDPFGNIEKVKKDLESAVSENITYYSVPNADHSYRDFQTKQPVYEDMAVELTFKK